MDPDRFVADLTSTLDEVLSDVAAARAMGAAGRARAVEQFSWRTVADRTRAVYEAVQR